MKTYQGLAAALRRSNAEVIFGLMGDANMHYLAYFVDGTGGRYISAIHEASAMSMADGYWRTSGQVGIVSVTHGPGFTNLLTPLYEAVRNNSEVLVLTGETPSDRTYGQRLDIEGLVAHTGAGYERVFRSESVDGDTRRALHRVRVERRPIVLNLPAELLYDDVADKGSDPPMWKSPQSDVPDETSLDAALGVLASAKRPVILAGRGAILSGARQALDMLAELLGAPVLTTLGAIDFFRGNPLNLGVCGTLSSDLAGQALAEADCMISFGASLNRFTMDEGLVSSGKRIIQCDTNPRDIGLFTSVDVAVLADAKTTAECMVNLLTEAEFSGTGWGWKYVEHIDQVDPLSDFVDRSTSDTIDPRTAAIILDSLLPDSRLWVSDLGRFHKIWKYLHCPRPGSFFHTAHFGSIGLALGTAIGAAVGDPSRLVVAIVGDGGFMQYAAELSTAVGIGAPLLVLVFNDSAYGMEYRKLVDHGADPRHCLSDRPDLARVCFALGAKSYVVRTASDAEALADVTSNINSPTVFDIRLDPEVDILLS